MKYQCQHKSSWGKRCTHGALRGKDYCAEHSKPSFSQTYAVSKSVFSPNGNTETNYHEYLQSEVWKERARLERGRNPNCSLCNRKGMLHVHHRTYVRLGNEKDGDLVVLCDECHELFHKNYVYQSTLGHFIRR